MVQVEGKEEEGEELKFTDGSNMEMELEGSV